MLARIRSVFFMLAQMRMFRCKFFRMSQNRSVCGRGIADVTGTEPASGIVKFREIILMMYLILDTAHCNYKRAER